MWAVLYNDVTTVRCRNILSQIYPQNIGLLDNKCVLPVGGELLFGPKFVNALVDQVNTLNKLDQAGKSAAAPPSQPRPSTSSGSITQNRYVQTRLAFSDSFGCRIAQFTHVWCQLKQDPWILSYCLYSHQPGQLFVNTNFWLFLADTITMDTEAKTPATATTTSTNSTTITKIIRRNESIRAGI